MANKVVQLVDKNSNNLYPIAGSVITDAVSTTAISNQAVTNPKIENGAVNGVANDATAIGTAKLALDTVGTPNLRDASVTSDKIDWATIPAFIKSADGETTSMPTVTFTAPENGNFWAIAVSGAVTPSNVMTYFDITATPTLVKTSGRLGVVEAEAKGVQTITTAHFGSAVKGTTYTFTVVLGGGSLLAPRPMNLTVFWSPNQ